MSIRKNIVEIMEEVKKETEEGRTDRGDAVRRLAVTAIKRGEGSREWHEYMSMYSRTPEQLSRLLASDGTKDSYEMDVARTYLVGNGVCGAASTGDYLLTGIGDTLDEGLRGADTQSGSPGSEG